MSDIVVFRSVYSGISSAAYLSAAENEASAYEKKIAWSEERYKAVRICIEWGASWLYASQLTVALSGVHQSLSSGKIAAQQLLEQLKNKRNEVAV
jgi:hypothetical protein